MTEVAVFARLEDGLFNGDQRRHGRVIQEVLARSTKVDFNRMRKPKKRKERRRWTSRERNEREGPRGA